MSVNIKSVRSSWRVNGYTIVNLASQWRTANVPPIGFYDTILAVPYAAQPIPVPLTSTKPSIIFADTSSVPLPSIIVPPSAPVAEIAGSYGDIYRRVWMIPTELNFVNPELGAQSPFLMWSAWNVKNTITSIAMSGTSAIALDVVIPYVFDASGSLVVNAIISDDSSPNISTFIVFSFNHGTSRTLHVSAQLLLFDRKIPDATVEESYNWLTNILTSYNGTEQRLSIRGAPRRIVTATFRLETDEQINRFHELVYRGNSAGIGVPMWQYASGLKNDVAIGQNTFNIDLSMTDVRVGDNVLIIDLQDETNLQVFTVASATSTTFTSLATSTKVFTAYKSVVVPLLSGKIQDSSSIRIDTVWGETSLTVEESSGHLITSRPDTPGTLVTMYDSLPVLDKQPLNTSNQMTTNSNSELIDYDVGKSLKKVNWKHPTLAINREFVVQRIQSLNEFDYWKEFAQAINGSQKPFLMRTFGNDLTIDPGSVSHLNNITVAGIFYGTTLFQRESHKRLVFHTDQGMFFRKVVNVVVDSITKTTTLTIDAPLPGTVTQNLYVEFLLKMRLSNDQIILTHDIDETILALSGTTVEQ